MRVLAASNWGTRRGRAPPTSRWGGCPGRRPPRGRGRRGVARVRQGVLDLFLERVGEFVAARGADEGVLQEEVEAVAAVAAAEHDAEGLEGLDGEPVAVGQDRLVAHQVLGDAAGALHVLRVAVVVGGDLALDARVGGAVDVVGVRVEGRQAAGEDRGVQALGGGGEVVDRAEAAEALAEDGPGGAVGERGADRLAVPDDRVGAEVREALGLLGGAAVQRERLAGERGGVAGAALVEEEDAVVVQGTAEPGLPTDETIRPETGSALEVDQPRQVLAVRLVAGDGLTGVELDGLARGVLVVEGHGEVAVGEDDAGLAIADGQRCSWDGRCAGRDTVQHMCVRYPTPGS